MKTDPSSKETARDHNLLVGARGDIDLPPRTEAEGRDEDDCMSYWESPRELRADVLTTVSLTGSLLAGSPGRMETVEGEVVAVQPGLYEVVGCATRSEGPSTHAIVVRHASSTVSTWRYLGRAHDSGYLLIESGQALEALPHPGDEAEESADDVIVCTADGKPVVWIRNSSGNGVKAFAGLAADARVVAVLMELY